MLFLVVVLMYLSYLICCWNVKVIMNMMVMNISVLSVMVFMCWSVCRCFWLVGESCVIGVCGMRLFFYEVSSFKG